MENIKHNGIDGVFIPDVEFREIKKRIVKQNRLTRELLKGFAPISARGLD